MTNPSNIPRLDEKPHKVGIATRVILLFYNFFIVPFLLILVFSVGVLFSEKIRRGIALRRSNKIRPGQLNNPIWIHASSGEFEYAKPVIRELKKNYPQIPVVVTYFSPSYAEVIRKFPGVDFSLPVPFDTVGATTDFLKRLNPRLLLVARTDFWPQLLASTQNAQIPSLLFSATLRPLKGLRFLMRPYYKWIAGFFNDLFVVSDDDKNHFLSSGTKTYVSALGDTRFDQVVHRLENPNSIKTHLFDSEKMSILVAGSTWPEDENKLFEACIGLLKSHSLKLVLAPHEISDSHIGEITKKLKSLDLNYQFYSETSDWSSEVLIVDKIGILAELYAYGHLAFVGGSFRAKVHSVMEPLAAGLVTFVGPFHSNNREALEFQNIMLNDRHPIVRAANNSLELRKHLETALQNSSQFSQNKELIRAEVAKRVGATRHVLSWVNSHIKEN